MKTKILITGVGGYIGSITTDLFLKNDFQVIGLDSFITGYKQPLELLQKKYKKESFRFYEKDLKDDISDIFENEKDIKAVIHFAGPCSVNESMQQPQKYFSNIVSGSNNLLSQIQKNGITNIVFSSTCAVYGEITKSIVGEDDPTNPTNPYGQSKLMVEQMIKWYGKLAELNYLILRYFNVCGATENSELGDSKRPSPHLTQNAVRGALGIEPFYLTCPKVDTADGTPIRDYVNVLDLAQAHLLAVKYLLKAKGNKIINLGTGKGNSVLDIIKIVEKETNHKFDLNYSKPRSGEYAYMVASNKIAKEILDWSPKYTIEDSVKSLINWYRKHPEGWKY